jgi:pyroglutamyl-peptidase
MKTKILLTSFQAWLPHQKTNSSDDLLAKIQKLDYSGTASLSFLRNIPVDIKLASQQVIAEIEKVKPDTIICCGMAEKRNKLTIESNASCENECFYTSINLQKLSKMLVATEISHDAGKFVCEGLYYQLLKYIQSINKNVHCIFVHVPVLEYNHSRLIQRDFHFIILAFAWKFTELTKTEKHVNNK